MDLFLLGIWGSHPRLLCLPQEGVVLLLGHAGQVCLMLEREINQSQESSRSHCRWRLVGEFIGPGISHRPLSLLLPSDLGLKHKYFFCHIADIILTLITQNQHSHRTASLDNESGGGLSVDVANLKLLFVSAQK